MMSLIDLVRACRNATVEHEEIRFAEDLVCQIGPSLQRFIFGQTRRELVEDVYQNTLIAIAKDVAKCRAETDKEVQKWCFGIAVNKLADARRREKRHPTVSVDINVLEAAVEASGKEERIESKERAELDFALELLRAAAPPCVDYLWERIAFQLSYKDIGEMHEQSEDAARMRVKRCLELAQELVSKKLGGVHG
jgi:RNA polymerase sigma factor (sigma-70 family)